MQEWGHRAAVRRGGKGDKLGRLGVKSASLRPGCWDEVYLPLGENALSTPPCTFENDSMGIWLVCR